MQSSEHTNAIDGTLLDLLVDGELAEERRRELLVRLDQEPEGWKRCALAFLEAQAWRAEFNGALREGAVVPTTTVHESSHRAPLLRQNVLVGFLAATSALIAAAFGLGWWTGVRQTEQSATVARGPSSTIIVPETAQPAEQNTESVRPAQVAAPPPRPAELDPVKVAGMLGWTMAENGRETKVAMPLLEGPGIDVDWLLSQPAAIREPVRKELERRGHKVELHRRLITLNLHDGRSVVVPVDQVEVKFAGRVFQ